MYEMMKRVFNTNGNLKLYWTTELSAKPVEQTYKIITKKIITDCQVYWLLYTYKKIYLFIYKMKMWCWES